jgi:hypothetical protein
VDEGIDEEGKELRCINENMRQFYFFSQVWVMAR